MQSRNSEQKLFWGNNSASLKKISSSGNDGLEMQRNKQPELMIVFSLHVI